MALLYWCGSLFFPFRRAMDVFTNKTDPSLKNNNLLPKSTAVSGQSPSNRFLF